MEDDSIHSSSDEVILEHNGSVIRIIWGDIFLYPGIKVIPVSRHFFETNVVEESLLWTVISRYKQNYKRRGLEKYTQALFTALESKEFERAPVALGTSMGALPKQEHLISLRRILVERFSDNELQDLCFDLSVNYEGLSGEGKNGKARGLIEHLNRHGRILELVRTGEQMRPDINWARTFQANEEIPLAERLYPLGTTATIDLKNDKYCLVAITWTESEKYIPDDNCSVTNLWIAMEKFWRGLRRFPLATDVNIPLIGSGVIGINLKPIHLLELNLLMILNSMTAEKRITSTVFHKKSDYNLPWAASHNTPGGETA